jgi:hypothetical protein
MIFNRRTALVGLIAAPAAAHAQPADFGMRVALGAEARTRVREIYDPAYRAIGYPMGDVPDDRGVCADTVVRAFRAADVDLQALVHRDMAAAFSAYPKIWGLTRPDANIDHRRVPNLETFFTRKGASLGREIDVAALKPGDLVSWRIPVPHIGVVSTQSARERPLMVHNVGAGSRLEDVLFAWPVQGWFRYAP